MESDDVVVPGARDVRGTLDHPDGERAVVACPPHPQFGGNRTDRRLTAVAEALADRDVATLRIDYGEWDEGRGEQADVENALAWARERYPRVALFGYSFGSMMALRAAVETDPAAVSALAPDAGVADDVEDLPCPAQVLYGTRDDTVDWAPVVERAREANDAGRDPPIDLVECSADHHFVGQHGKVARNVADFLDEHL